MKQKLSLAVILMFINSSLGSILLKTCTKSDQRVDKIRFERITGRESSPRNVINGDGSFKTDTYKATVWCVGARKDSTFFYFEYEGKK